MGGRDTNLDSAAPSFSSSRGCEGALIFAFGGRPRRFFFGGSLEGIRSSRVRGVLVSGEQARRRSGRVEMLSVSLCFPLMRHF